MGAQYVFENGQVEKNALTLNILERTMVIGHRMLRNFFRFQDEQKCQEYRTQDIYLQVCKHSVTVVASTK